MRGHDIGPFHCDHPSNPPPGEFGGDFMDDIFADDPSIYGQWLRFAGEGGDTIYTEPVGWFECGTRQPIWLSGWNPQNGIPPPDYQVPGSLPNAEDGIKPMTVSLSSSLLYAFKICALQSQFCSSCCSDAYQAISMMVPVCVITVGILRITCTTDIVFTLARYTASTAAHFSYGGCHWI